MSILWFYLPNPDTRGVNRTNRKLQDINFAISLGFPETWPGLVGISIVSNKRKHKHKHKHKQLLSYHAMWKRMRKMAGTTRSSDPTAQRRRNTIIPGISRRVSQLISTQHQHYYQHLITYMKPARTAHGLLSSFWSCREHRFGEMYLFLFFFFFFFFFSLIHEWQNISRRQQCGEGKLYAS